MALNKTDYMGLEVTTTNQHLHDASNALFATVADRIGAVAVDPVFRNPLAGLFGWSASEE